MPLAFPPLESVVILDGAPERVHQLLTRRWMAEPLSAEPASAFQILWGVKEGVGEAAGSPSWAVRWEPTEELGQLVNDTGRVLLVPGGSSSRVELEPDFVDRPAGLEALVEATLAHALAAQGECFLHAAAFELSGRRPLVVGETGAGKSTLTAAAVAAGGRAVSDDSLLLGVHDNRPLVRSARRDLWLRPGSRGLLPALNARGLGHELGPDGRFRVGRDNRGFVDAIQPDCLVVVAGRGALAARPLTQADALATLLRSTSSLYMTDERFSERQVKLLSLLTRYAEHLPAIGLRIDRSPLEGKAESLAALIDLLP